MSSLVPGPIFLSSGLNRNSTPTPPDITPAQLDERYRRVDFNGHDWPRESPISRMYDVANTSTKLIILNNKYGKNSTRLRGYYTGPKKPERHIDPDRHRAPSPRNPRFHTSCYDSSSPKFEPTLKTDLEWVSSSHRPPNALIGAYLYETRSSVNPRRHATCQAPPDLPVHDGRPRSRMSLPPNKYFVNSEYADMSMGEKIYMWSIEKIYNMDKMKQLKQEQYRKLLDMEAKKGYHGYQEYVKYMRYINSAKDRSYGTGTPSDKRSKSAYSPRSQRSKSATSRSSPTKSETKSEDGIENGGQDQPERPKTSLGHSRQEPLRDTQTSDSDDSRRRRTTSVGSAGRTSIGSQRSQPKSPSPSRKSSAKSSAAGSQRSLRSGNQAKNVEKTKGDHSDSSLTNGEDAPQLHKEGKDRPKSRLGHPGIESKDQAVAVGEEAPVHHEGKDRPKSRLGHPGADDRDQDSIHSSSLSIKSDHSNLSSDSGVENGRKEKKPKYSSDTSSISSVENTNKRRNNQGERKKNRQLELLKAKQSKTMGSRSSVNSRSSSRSDTEHARSGKGNRNNEKAVDKEINKQEITAESSDKETKVHRIPSGTFVNEETTYTGKTGEGIDINLNNDKDDKKIETTEKTTSALEEEKTDDSKVQSDDIKVENIEETKVAEEKLEDQASEKPIESENITSEEPRMEVRNESQNLVKTDAQEIEREGESNVEIKEDNSEQQQQQQQQQQQLQLLPEDDAGKDDRERNKLSRQDSFEDDDEDRKVNRDLDKIEY